MSQSFSVEGVLSFQDKGFSNTLKNAANSLSGFGKNAGSNFENAGRSMDGLSDKADKARSSILNIATGIGAMQLVTKAVDMIQNSVSGAIRRFDTLNQYPKVMSQLGYSAKDVSASMDILQNGIKGLPTALDDVVSSTQQFASITGDVETAAKTTIALNDAFLASGSSAADAARGLQQYTQMLSSGKVDLMSWRTLQETMPSALKKVAEAFGYAGRSATNDLYAALQDGSITVDQLNQKFV
ncbi:tape measure protein [Companilactobacillus furfuricola]|uniref:tape measure protein n=1 Tax=Companilactobacillus furfuricola TaxID=1462575 RepID=UPI000F78BBFD|nr:tape measure protein [Companilactobacillus furfuricola]